MPDRWIDEHVGEEAAVRPGFEAELGETLQAAWQTPGVSVQPLRQSGPARRTRTLIWAAAASVVLIGGLVVLTQSGKSHFTTGTNANTEPITAPITTPATPDATAEPTTQPNDTEPVTTVTTPVAVAHTADEQTVLDYLAALAQGRWDEAAKLLGEGGLEPSGRADLRPLLTAEGTLPSLAGALQEWCARPAMCDVPTALSTVDNRIVATFVVDGVERSTIFGGGTFEGSPLVTGLPLRLPPAGTSLADTVQCPTTNVSTDVLADLNGDGWAETVVLTRSADNLTAHLDVCGTTLRVPQYSSPAGGQLTVYGLDIEGDGTDELMAGGFSVDTFYGSIVRWDGGALTPTGQEVTQSNPPLRGAWGSSFGCEAYTGTRGLVLYSYQYEGGTDLSNSTALNFTVTPLNPDGTVNPIPIPAGRFELPAQETEAFHLIAGYCGPLPVQTG